MAETLLTAKTHAMSETPSMAQAPKSGKRDKSTAQLSLLKQSCGLIVSVTVCFAAAGIGAAATVTSVRGWYQTIAKPAWNPPDWIFGPVWSTLYFMMAVAVWLVWRRTGWQAGKKSIIWFLVQLGLNICWSAIFFGLHLPGLAFIEIAILWLAIAMTINLFRTHSKLAAGLMMPYIAWTTFAAILNASIWWLNL